MIHPSRIEFTRYALSYTLRWVILRLFSQHKCVEIRRSQGSLSGSTIAFTIRSVDHSLFIRLILLFMGCFGDCLNHGFSLIKRITQIIRFVLSKIELVFSTIMVSNTTYAAPAGRGSEMGFLWSYRGDHNLTDCGTEIYGLT